MNAHYNCQDIEASMRHDSTLLAMMAPVAGHPAKLRGNTEEPMKVSSVPSNQTGSVNNAGLSPRCRRSHTLSTAMQHPDLTSA